MDSIYSSRGYYGLPSSIYALDGIPFKIGPKFKPPLKVNIPNAMVNNLKPDFLSEEYMFTIEQAVIYWAEAKQKVSTEQEECDKHNDTAGENAIPAEGKTKKGRIHHLGDINDYVNGSTNKQTKLIRPWQNKNRSLGDRILTPTIAQTELSSNGGDALTSKFDVSLFEQEDDPFDNVERQVIDEYEELKTVLQNSMEPSSALDGSQTDKSTDSDAVSNHKDMMNDVEKSEETENDAPIYENIFSKDMVSFSSKSKTDKDVYVNLSFVKGKLIQERNGSSQHSCLPPIPNCRKSPPSSKSFMKGSPLPTFGSCSNPVNKSDDENIYSNFPLNEQEHSHEPSILSKDRHSLSVDENVSIYSNLSFEKGNLRNTHSTPDICQSLTKLSTQDLRALSKPPIPAKRNGKKAGKMRKSWDHYPPILSTINGQQKSPNSVNTDKQDDSSMSKSDSQLEETEQFIKKFVMMGFPQSRILKAVDIFGINEKEVVEHLCLVDSLAEAGFETSKSESALLFFKNNIRKARNYLQLHKQFEELGFDETHIHQALINSELDRDRALDYLTK